ncbi:permease prefix domain 1-containing protein [Labedaea rhizosphaerae]|uniref:Uncharacterized protein n=1 Tax=Labedaea rhizosphaerae TaxID=598644 RepID=A0A4R6S3Z6_LABRH|nr:permease prefix domain 1-containing protein [Labedaea rhizosphaerae]TDP93807.1 hypothetical protein EV186_106201 [Labedaea rhizosphaerae]
MADTGVIDSYLADLDARLRGMASTKAELLAEARDGLVDAAEAHEERGLTPLDAQRAAIEEFGPVDEIGREYQAELSVAQGARLLRSMLLALPAVHALWELTALWSIGAWDQHFGTKTPPWYLSFAWANDRVVWLSSAIALVALLGCRWAARNGVDSRRIARMPAVAGAVALGAVLVVELALLVATAVFDPHRLNGPLPTGLATLVSLVVAGRLLVLTVRSFAYSAGSRDERRATI